MIPVICKDSELPAAIGRLSNPPAIVITDSSVFKYVSKTVSESIPLTSFSILMARYKGILEDVAAGARVLSRIKTGDRILISEGCTHHRQCEDIGTVKLPQMIRDFYGVQPEFSFTSGGGFVSDISDYRLIIHCGGCMLTEREVGHRFLLAKEAGIPITNYGIAIAEMNGILGRSIACL